MLAACCASGRGMARLRREGPMSLQPQAVYVVPEDTARVARGAFPKVNPHLRMHDELGRLYTDRDFAALFPVLGQPALAPAQLALVTLMQFAEKLTDRQAAEAVRARIDWKYALCLELDDPGFDYSVLCEFRARLPAVEALRQIWVQQYHAPDDTGAVRWRGPGDQAPSAVRLDSPHDAEARFGTKRETSWTGYKAHLTETCDPDTPHLIVAVQTTPATTPDHRLVAPIHTALAAAELLPAEHLVDTGYVDADNLLTSQREHQVELLGPILGDNSWQ